MIFLAGCAAPAGDVDTSVPETSPSDTSTPQTSAPEDSSSDTPAQGAAGTEDAGAGSAAPYADELRVYDTLADVPFYNVSFGYSGGGMPGADTAYDTLGLYMPTRLLWDGAAYADAGRYFMIYAADHPVIASAHELFCWRAQVGQPDVCELQRVGMDRTQVRNYSISVPAGVEVTAEGSVLHFSDGRSFDTAAVGWIVDGEVQPWGPNAADADPSLQSLGSVPSDRQPGEAWSEQYADWPDGYLYQDMPADTHGLQRYPRVEDVPHAALSLCYQNGSELGAGAGFEGVYAPRSIQKDGAALDALTEPQRRYMVDRGVAASESELFIMVSDYDGGNRHLRRISLTDDHSGDYELAFEARPQLFQNGDTAAAMVIAPAGTQGDVLQLENWGCYGSTAANGEGEHYTFGWDTVQKVWLIDGETVAPIAGVDMLSLAG